MKSNIVKPLSIVGSAVAGGLIATGIVLQVIPVIGTGTGAAAITSGLSILAGGAGMMAGIGVVGGIVTGSSAIGAGISAGIIEIIENAKRSLSSQELIRELRKYIPNITNSSDTVDDFIIFEKYKMMYGDISDEKPIWLHINEGYPYIDDSVVITNKKILHILDGKIVVDCEIKDIIRIFQLDMPFFRWDKLIIENNIQNKDISIKHKVIINTIIKIINKLKIFF